MSLKSFFKLVEIQTKVASITPFILGTVYSLYHYNAFNYQNFLLMLVSLLCIDMATTTINNYIDYKKANKKEGYGYESHNAIVRDNIRERSVILTIAILLILATTFGILLFLNTNSIVLIIGAISFMIGILYTFGPVPISRTPFGEILSGGFMGLIIPFIAMYIHVYDRNILDIVYKGNQLAIQMNAAEILSVLLISVPCAVGIGNIMLANNICDIEDDIENKRYTLPIYIGKKHALTIFKIAYYISFIAIVFAILLHILPLISVFSLFTYTIVKHNISLFYQKQSKEETFILSVKNFIITNIALIFTIVLGIIISYY